MFGKYLILLSRQIGKVTTVSVHKRYFLLTVSQSMLFHQISRVGRPVVLLYAWPEIAPGSVPSIADITDSNLMNPWSIAPSATSPFWKFA
jgi:hypothetical protein